MGVSRSAKSYRFRLFGSPQNSRNFRPYAAKHLKKNSYIERLGYGDYEPQREMKLSFVQEEWQFAIFYANAGVMQCIPIVRAGEPERMAALPLGVSPDNGFDMRDPADYPRQVRFAAWDGDHALIKLGWYCENYPGCAEKWVDAWPIDLLRPRLFLDRVFQTSACSQAQ